MLLVTNNSVLKDVFLSASGTDIAEFQKYLRDNRVELVFKADSCRFAVVGIKTIKVPRKCLKSFENLFAWVRERVNKELSNIK